MTTLAKAEGRNRPLIIEQHISWIKFYLSNMRDGNWQDMKLYAERQVEALANELPSPPTKDSGV